LSPENRDKLLAALKPAVGSSARRMPIRCVLADEFRAGLEREWPRLSTEERRMVRAPVRDGQARTLG
jgi:hypothetical protein